MCPLPAALQKTFFFFLYIVSGQEPLSVQSLCLIRLNQSNRELLAFLHYAIIVAYLSRSSCSMPSISIACTCVMPELAIRFRRLVTTP